MEFPGQRAWILWGLLLLIAKIAFFMGLLFFFTELPLCVLPPLKMLCSVLLLNAEDFCVSAVRMEVWDYFYRTSGQTSLLVCRWMLVWSLQQGCDTVTKCIGEAGQSSPRPGRPSSEGSQHPDPLSELGAFVCHGLDPGDDRLPSECLLSV